MSEPPQLDCALVTGASAGLGEEFARQLGGFFEVETRYCRMSCPSLKWKSCCEAIETSSWWRVGEIDKAAQL